MGYSLDELLDATGIGSLADEPLPKTASAASEPAGSLSKLAERCRQAAEDKSVSQDKELAEKVASVAIVQKILQECAEIEGVPREKTAASFSSERAATFIKEALAKGHNPEDIATFLDKLGFRSSSSKAEAGTAHMRKLAQGVERISQHPEAWGKVKKSPYTYAGGGAAAAMALKPGGDSKKRKGPVTIIQ